MTEGSRFYYPIGSIPKIEKALFDCELKDNYANLNWN